MLEIGLIPAAGAFISIILAIKVVQWIIALRYHRAYRDYVNREGTLSAIVQRFKLRNPQRLVAYIESRGVTISPEEKAPLNIK